ncbi:MAG: hypothetical protein ACFFG0_04105 [Candidatus Thorarchaeota archaeon]
MKTFITMIMLLVISVIPVSAEIFENPGMEVSIGRSGSFAPGADDPSHDFTWISLSLLNKFDINEKWNIDLLGTVGHLWWKSKEYNQYKKTYSIGSELILYRIISKRISVGLGGGFATLTEKKDLPELGNSGLYGTITGRVKVKIGNEEDYGLIVAADHISDALQDGDDGDSGKNVLSLKFYFMF